MGELTDLALDPVGSHHIVIMPSWPEQRGTTTGVVKFDQELSNLFPERCSNVIFPYILELKNTL